MADFEKKPSLCAAVASPAAGALLVLPPSDGTTVKNGTFGSDARVTAGLWH
jgi:hypothetical protein